MTLLNHIVTLQLCPQALSAKSDSIPQSLEQLHAEKNRITALMLRLSDLPAGNSRRTAAVSFWQRTIVRLLDVLHSYEEVPGSQAFSAHYTTAAASLLQVMTGLEQHFPDDLSPEWLLPHAYARAARTMLLPRLLQADREMTRLSLEAPLRRIILEPVWNFLERPEERISFGELIFLRNLIAKLLLFAHPAHAAADNARLNIHHLLVSINFNAAGYFVYCVEALRLHMHTIPGLRERMKLLGWCMRELKNIPPVSRENGLRPGCFPIREQLLVWLKEERIFIRHLMSPALPAGAENTWSTRLTVPQAALMARVYMEEGLVKTASLQQVFTTLAGILHLRKADTGEEDAFRIKFQNPSLSTVTACKQWIGKVLDRLNDYESQLRTSSDL